MLMIRFYLLTAILLLAPFPPTVRAESGENGPPAEIDTYDHITVNVHEIGSAESVSGQFLVDHDLASRTNRDSGVSAQPGYTIYWVFATIDRIETVHVRAVKKIWLYDKQGKTYEAKSWSVRGVTFLDLHDISGGTRIEPGADLTAWFTIPEGVEPASVSLTYAFTRTWEKGVVEEPSEAKLDFDLTEK